MYQQDSDGFTRVIGVSAKKQQRAALSKIAAYNSLPASERNKIDKQKAKEKARLERLYTRWAKEAEADHEYEQRRREITGREDPIVEQTLREWDRDFDRLHLKLIMREPFLRLTTITESCKDSQSENADRPDS